MLVRPLSPIVQVLANAVRLQRPGEHRDRLVLIVIGILNTPVQWTPDAS